MPDEEGPGPEAQGSTFEAYALYNEVRQEIFREQMTCLRKLQIVLSYAS